MKTILRRLAVSLERWTLKRLRLALDAADEWLHAHEVQFRTSQLSASEAPARTPAEFDRAKSAARERATKKARAPRLRYVAGAWVRE
jgi:hypothetical protein